MSKIIKIEKEEVPYHGFFQLQRYQLRHSLFAGGMSETISREVLERGHAVAVLPYDPVRDEVVMVEQFRIGALGDTADNANNAWLLEIIAGMIEPEESVTDVVHREAEEEAQCHLSQLEKIHTFYVSPGGTSETTALFCGKTDTRQIGDICGVQGEHEDIKVHVYSFDEAVTLLEQGKICSAAPIIALQWLQMNRARLRQLWSTPALS